MRGPLSRQTSVRRSDDTSATRCSRRRSPGACASPRRRAAGPGRRDRPRGADATGRRKPGLGHTRMTTDTGRTHGGLGRGLASLIPTATGTGTREIEISRIVANPYQPRGQFQEEELATLAASIVQHGVIQPILVTEAADGYQLIAGERRLRASVLAGNRTIPAIVRTADEQSQ